MKTHDPIAMQDIKEILGHIQKMLIDRPDRFLTLKDVTAKTTLHKTSIYRRMEAGDFPQSIKLSRNTVWSEIEVVQWMEEQKAGVES